MKVMSIIAVIGFVASLVGALLEWKYGGKSKIEAHGGDALFVYELCDIIFRFVGGFLIGYMLLH